MSNTLSSPNETAPVDLYADFSQIKGIGQSMTQRLYKLGFTQFADLARHTPEDLANLLKQNGLTISPQRIERDNWINQAKELATKEAKSEAKKRSFETPWTNAGDWHERADFFVSFGYLITKDGEKRMTTRAAPSQSGNEPKVWDGIAGEELIRWMLEEANLPLSEEVGRKSTGFESSGIPSHQPAPDKDLDAKLSIRNICEVQMGSAIKDLSLKSAIRIEGLYSLPTSAYALTTRYTTFSVEAYLIDLLDNQYRLVASRIGQLQSNVMSYSVLLDFEKPPRGRYQLYLVSQLIESGDAWARVKGPILQFVN